MYSACLELAAGSGDETYYWIDARVFDLWHGSINETFASLIWQDRAVESSEDFVSHLVGDIGDVLKGVVEGTDDERVVVSEGPFDEVESDAARVDDDVACDVGSRGVDYGRPEC